MEWHEWIIADFPFLTAFLCFDRSGLFVSNLKKKFFFIFCCPHLFFYWTRVKSGLVEVGSVFGGAQIACWVVSWEWWRVFWGAFSLGRVRRWRFVPPHCNLQQLTRPPLSEFVTSRAPNRWSSHSVMRCHELPGTEKRMWKENEKKEGGWVRELARALSAVSLTLPDSQDDLTLLLPNILTTCTTSFRHGPSQLNLKLCQDCKCSVKLCP